MSDSLDYVNAMLDNEDTAVSKNASKQKKHKKKIKKAPRKVHVYTEQELVDSGWNLKFDPDLKEEYKEGDVYELSQKQREYAKLPDGAVIHLHRRASLYNMACVSCPAFSIYGWGRDFEHAIKECLKNMKAWAESYPGRIDDALNIWRKNLLKNKETAEKTVTDILDTELA